MKTLYPKQKEAFDFFSIKQKSGSNTLDTSHVGTGKTVVAGHLAKSLNRPVAVLCPKAVIPSWERELKETGIDPLFVLNYEKIRTGKTTNAKDHTRRTPSCWSHSSHKDIRFTR